LKQLRGGRRLNPHEPRPPRAIPDCPEQLQGEARAEYHRITKQLHAIGLISQLDRAALVAYCAAWQRFTEAHAHIAETGPVVKSPSGFPILNPYLSVLNSSVKQMQSLLAELGLSPAARTRLHARPPEQSRSLKSKKYFRDTV
jgi:P27 family predicted phage terminase small subunit